MNKFYQILVILLFPSLAMAADSSSALSFAPPTQDVSVVLLGDLFGVVDGVLNGAGTQIMGKMFGVFNSAVLALGGIIIMYTLLVSTMNTAQEGQFLGQKWSSLWVPIRTTFGLALLIPKQSGYCLMQIFVMWIILQGIGAADKIWNAALNYLNQGGSIITVPKNPTAQLTDGGSGTGLLKDVEIGAQAILAGQVCMLGLENQLKNQRQIYSQQKQQKTGPCYAKDGDSIQADFDTICNTPVPSLINSVNVIDVRENTDQSPYTVNMPNLPTNNKYSSLNGICGSISWEKKPVSSSLGNINTGIDTSSLSKSRSIAIQQMYSILSPVAQQMVNNNPLLSTSGTTNQSSDNNYSDIASSQFGIPLTTTGSACTTIGGCTIWGQAPGTDQMTLFAGTEFIGAINAYNGVMLPLLTLETEANNQSQASSSRAFIQDAEASGWILAGSYYFDLVILNQQAMAAASNSKFDKKTGLDGSKVGVENLTSAFSGNGKCSSTSKYSLLCTWFGKDLTRLTPIVSLVSGGANGVSTVKQPSFDQSQMTVVEDTGSSTVFGFTNNSLYIKQPDQPGAAPPIQMQFNIPSTLPNQTWSLPEVKFECGELSMPMGFSTCLGSIIGAVLWNGIVIPVYDALESTIDPLIQSLLMAFILVPLQGFAFIFTDAIEGLSAPGINPIIALAQMGTYYINFAGEIWFKMLELSIVTIFIPLLGLVIFPIIALTMPLVLSWIGVMLSIGFTTAYYIPVLPYMIFTLGSLAWFISVIEAMVAAPLVALGVTHPEGHEAFGKGESAVMILMNVFLRPSMMVIGFITGIAMTYVSVWLLNAGYEHATAFIQADSSYKGPTWGEYLAGASAGVFDLFTGASISVPTATQTGTSTELLTGGYTSWAGVFAFFFVVLIYVSTYITLVQRSFTLITYLPDKVLRWIGGAPESIGQEAQQWGEETKGKVSEAGKETGNAKAAMEKQMSGYANKGMASAKKAFGQKMEQPSASASGSKQEKSSSSEGSKPPGGSAPGAAPGAE